MNIYFDELIISSGGNKGFSIVGALNKFIKYYDLKKIKYLTGCSIGAIICFMINIGYTIEELNDIIFQINFEIFQELKIINIIEKCGFDEGIKITNFLKALIINKNYNPNITFLELFEKTEQILTITTTNITKGIPEYHNKDTTPDLSILLSVRMSSNIPIVFAPIIYNNNYYLDGALLDPYPYFFIKNTKKIGIWLFDTEEFNFINSFDIQFINSTDNMLTYVLSLLKIVYVNYMKKFYKKIPKNTIYINYNTDNSDFSVSKDEKMRMFKLGVSKAKKFFKRMERMERMERQKNIEKKQLQKDADDSILQ
jgi:NTE family protein